MYLSTPIFLTYNLREVDVMGQGSESHIRKKKGKLKTITLVRKDLNILYIGLYTLF